MSGEDLDYSIQDTVRSQWGILPFHLDPNWVEAPGCLWTPAIEENLMPSRFPTAGEKAETSSHRGASEGDYKPLEDLTEADAFAQLADDLTLEQLAEELGETPVFPFDDDEESYIGD